MKKLLIGSLIAAGSVAALVFYIRSKFGQENTSGDIADAAGDASSTAKKFIRREENAFDPVLN